jgi:uncharacterized SAM-binding protein YcdF (DUF218 family)
MFLFLSKLLPQLMYPLGLSLVLTIVGVIMVWRRRLAIAYGAFTAAMLILYLSSTPLIAESLARSLEWQSLPATIDKADAIVVLGGGTKSPIAPRVLPEVGEAGDRVIYAAKLYRDGKAAKLIVSGGRVTWQAEPGSEASDMATLLIMLGVPKTAILEEPVSLNTRQNAERVKVIVEREQFKRLILVTSATHMPRSLAIFRRLGMDVAPAPTDFVTTQPTAADRSPQGKLLRLLPDAEQLFVTTRSLKEYVGLWVYKLRGWA